MAEQGTDLSELLTLTTDIVASHVSNNGVPVSELPQLIQQVYATLAELGKEAAPAAEKPQPAVPIRKSITPHYPMVAPNYAEQRRDLAKKIGLGTSRSRRGTA